MTRRVLQNNLYGRELKKFDGITTGIKILTTDHASIHAGNGFNVSWFVDNIANDNKYYFVFKTRSSLNRIVHFKDYKLWVNNAKVIMRFYEDPDVDPSPATSVDIVCRCLQNGKTSVSQAGRGTGVDVTGAKLLETFLFGGGGNTPATRSGGTDDLDIEWILKPDTYYVFEFENKSGSAVDIGYWAFWYEEPIAFPGN
jgi:hypothetical protein